MTLLNESARARMWKILVYGASGSGKTTLGVTAPRPVILLGELQGWEAVRDAARLYKRKTPPTFLVQDMETMRVVVSVLGAGGKDVLPRLVDGLARHHLARADQAEGALAAGNTSAIVGQRKHVQLGVLQLQELREAWSPDRVAAMKASLPYGEPSTVVLDSMTEFLNLVADDVDASGKQEKGKDGLEVRSMRAAGVIKMRGERFIRAMRDLPYHVLMLARLEDKEIGEGEAKERVVQPLTPQRSFPETMMAACNACGIMEIVRLHGQGEGGQMATSHGVSFAEPSYKRTKALRPLRDKETSNVTGWFKRLDAAASGAPDPAPEDAPPTETDPSTTPKSEEVPNVL